MGRCMTIAFVILGLLLPGKALTAPAPVKSVIAHAAVNARVLPLWAAKEQGFFSKYGVPAEMIFIRQAPTLVAALTSGDIQIGYTGGTAVLGAAASGSDLKNSGGLYQPRNLRCRGASWDQEPRGFARKNIRRPKYRRDRLDGSDSRVGALWLGCEPG